MNKEVEVMRVLRVPPRGKLVVEFRGQRYENISEIAEENVKRFLLTAVGELIDFANGYQHLVNEGLAPALAPIATAPPAAKEEEALTPAQRHYLEQLEAASVAEKSQRRPPPKSMLFKTADLPSASAQALNPVQQINHILQNYLDADEELRQRTVYLRQHPAGGVEIFVDGKVYQRPTEIEEPRLQLLIKKAIKEWDSAGS